MKIKVTTGWYHDGYPDTEDFLNSNSEAEKTMFDSEKFLNNIKNILQIQDSEILEKIKSFDTTKIKKNISWLSEYIYNIDKDQVSVKLEELKWKINSQNVSKIWDKIKDLWEVSKESLNEIINIWNYKIKKWYILMYIYIASMWIWKIELWSKWDQVKQEWKWNIAQVLESWKQWEINKKPSLAKVNQATVEVPVVKPWSNGIFVPDNSVTTADTSWNFRNLLLPWVEKLNWVTLCAKTTREVSEKLYWYESKDDLIIREEYANDNDAIGYYLRGKTEDSSRLKEKYQYFDHIQEINTMNASKKITNNNNITYSSDIIDINDHQFGILVTTQSNLSVVDGHQATVCNMYNVDGTVQSKYVYDPYLYKSIRKWHNKLDQSEKEKYNLNPSSWYFVDLDTYLKYCENKDRAPLWVMVYNQPEWISKLIANTNIAKNINIKQSHFKQFVDIYPKVQEFVNQNKDKIWEDFLYTSFEEDLANLYQESRLSPFAINKWWFTGIWQMNNRSLKAVYEHYPFVKELFGDKKKVRQLNVDEMIIAAKLYKNWVLYKEMKSKWILDTIDDDYKKEFLLAGYNRWAWWLSKIINKYKHDTGKSWKITRDSMRDYYLWQIDKWQIKKQWHIELFGKWDDLWYVDNIISKEADLKEYMDQQDSKDLFVGLDNLTAQNSEYISW